MRRKVELFFKFGDGKLYKSLKLVAILAKNGNKDVIIMTDVINSELLLSKKAIKITKVKIDFDSDVITILGQVRWPRTDMISFLNFTFCLFSLVIFVVIFHFFILFILFLFLY